MTLIHVYFADLKMFRYITDELFSWQDILAAFGGLGAEYLFLVSSKGQIISECLFDFLNFPKKHRKI